MGVYHDLIISWALSRIGIFHRSHKPAQVRWRETDPHHSVGATSVSQYQEDRWKRRYCERCLQKVLSAQYNSKKREEEEGEKRVEIIVTTVIICDPGQHHSAWISFGNGHSRICHPHSLETNCVRPFSLCLMCSEFMPWGSNSSLPACVENENVSHWRHVSSLRPHGL